MQKLALALISWYQKYLAAFNGLSVCRFSPRCSQYTSESISQYGLWKGGWMGVSQILHCHPWSHNE